MKCNICKSENDINTHYCIKCGNNLSSNIEKTDVIFFFGNFLKIIGFLGILIFTIPIYLISNANISFDGSYIGHALDMKDIAIISIPVMILILGFVLRKIGKEKCKLNIKDKKE